MFYNFILLILLIVLILFYYYYEENKYFTEGKKLIHNLRKNKRNSRDFDSIKKYYINLDRSTERNKNILNEFKLYNIKNYKRITGCDGKNIKNIHNGDFNGLRFVNNKDNGIWKAALATSCSHLKAIKEAYEEGNEMAIILEDDIKFTLLPFWEKEFKKILENLPDDLEILQLTYGFIKNFRYFLKNITKQGPGEHLNSQKIKRRFKNETFCAGCYLITKKGMKKIVDNFFKDDIIYNNLEDFGIDVGIFNVLNTYYLSRPLFPLDSFEYKSTIRESAPDYYLSYKILDFYKNLK